MSRTSKRVDGDIVRDLLSIADLLEEPRLAQLYAYLAREGEATVQDVMDALELAQGTAYSYVSRLDDAGVVDVTDDEQPRRYAAREIDLRNLREQGILAAGRLPHRAGLPDHLQ